MAKEIVVRGTLSGPRRVDFDEAVTGVAGAVMVTLRPAGNGAAWPDVFGLIATLPPGARSKLEIDQALADERAAWSGR